MEVRSVRYWEEERGCRKSRSERRDKGKSSEERWRGCENGEEERETYVARLMPRVTFLSQRYGSNPSELSSMLTRLTWLESID